MKVLLLEVKFTGHDVANLNAMQASYVRYEIEGKSLGKPNRIDRIYDFDEGSIDINFTKKETIADWLKCLETNGKSNSQILFWELMDKLCREKDTLFVFEDDFALEVLAPSNGKEENGQVTAVIDDEYTITSELMKATNSITEPIEMYLEFKRQMESMKSFMRRNSKKVRIGVKRLKNDLAMPYRATKGSSGADVAICEESIIWPGKSDIIKTGLSFNIPEGYEIQLRPRSSSMAKLRCMVQFGTIDQDYTGEVKIMVTNMSSERIILAAGTALGQLVVQKIPDVEYYEIEELQKTERGSGGFGSTGLIHEETSKK